MMKKIIPFLIITIVLNACNSDVHFKKFVKTENLEWLKTDKINISVENEDDSSNFNVFIAFRFADGFQFNAIPLTIVEKTPVGNFTNTIAIKTRDEKGSYIGEVSGDIWDIEVPLKTNVKLAKGNYTFEIEHNLPVAKAQMVMEVGLIIKKSE